MARSWLIRGYAASPHADDSEKKLGRTDERKNNRPSGLEAVMAIPANYVMSAIGSVVSIGAFVALVTSQSVKTWVKSHPYPIYLALIVAVLAIAGTLDYAYNLRKRIALPSNHDKKFYAAALEGLPPDGTVIRWLKNAEMTEASVADFPADVLSSLENAAVFSRTQPVGFDDTQIARSFKSLSWAISDFCHSVDRWTFTAHDRAIDAATGAETAALSRRHHDLVRAYDRFIRTAHARGIDIDGS